MDIKKISVKVIFLCSFTMGVSLLFLIIINDASIVSITTVIALVGSYIAGELYLWKHKMEEREKEYLHLGLCNIALSISFLISGIVFLAFGYGVKGVIPSILFITFYCISGASFTALFIKRANQNVKGKNIARASLGPIIGGMIGIGGARIFLKDVSQSTLILIAICIGYVLSMVFLLGALSFYCKFILIRKNRICKKQDK